MVKTVSEKKVKKTISKEEPSLAIETTPILESKIEQTVETNFEQTVEQIVETNFEQTVEEIIDTTEDNSNEESNTEQLFNKLINQFQDVQLVMKTLHFNMKILQKEVLRERKELKKKESKIKKKSDKKKNKSGLKKPTPISEELSSFLKTSEHELARTEVTTKVIAYIKEKNLQNPANKKQILPDTDLENILQAGNDVVTFFNLSRYLKKHFLPVIVSDEVVEK
jgi:upstream activation factor subunit UAF30